MRRIWIILLIIVLAVVGVGTHAEAALPSDTCWEVQTGGSDTLNSGGFCGNGITAAPAPGDWSVADGGAGGTVVASNYEVKICFNNLRGDGPSSATKTVTVATNHKITITAPSTGSNLYATSYTVYIDTATGNHTGGPYFFQSPITALGTNLTITPPFTTTVAAGPQLATAPGIDRSQQTTAQLSSANFTTAILTTTSIAFVGYTPTCADVDNIVYVPALTGVAAGFYQIISFSSTTWTLDRSVGAGNAGSDSIFMGGAFQSMGEAGNAIFNLGGTVAAGQSIWVRQGSYAAGSGGPNTTSTNVSNGCLSFSTNGTNLLAWMICGYATAGGRGDYTARPTITNSANSATMIASSAAFTIIDNLILDCGSGSTTTTGISTTCTIGFVLRCKVSNSATNGIIVNQQGVTVAQCEVLTFTGTAGINAGATNGNFGSVLYCEAHGGTGTNSHGIQTSGAGAVVGCLSYSNTGSGACGFKQTGGPGVFDHCTSYGNGLHGFQWVNVDNTNTRAAYFNCASEGNGATTSTGSGWEINSNSPSVFWFGCAGFNNAGGFITGSTALTTSFLPINQDYNLTLGHNFLQGYNTTAFTSSTNFALTSTSVLRATGFFGTSPSGNSVGYADVGAIQHADPLRNPVTTAHLRGD